MSRPTTPLPTSSQKDLLFTSSGRSSTHPVEPRHHIPHHPHRVHHHHHHHSHHRHDKSVPQTAIFPTTSNPFGEFLAKTASGLSEGTKTPPRRNEAAIALREEEERRERERAQWKEVERMRVKRTAVDEDLRTTLSSLSELSTSTTRRLDYTYYSLLSSLSALTSTLTSLHKLSTSTTDLSTQFNNDSTNLVSEIKFQVKTGDKGFKGQARRISDLEGRMKRGREKVKMLGEILEVVRGKVEREAEKDREGRKRIGRRLMMLWGFLGVWGVMALVLMVVRHWPGVGIDIREAKLLELGNRSWDPREEDLAVRKPNLTNEGTNVGGKASGLNAGDPAQTSEVERQDPILRLFDEL